MELEGVPPIIDQAYAEIVPLQGSTIADGAILPPLQISGIGFILNCGLVLAVIIVGGEVKVPHLLVSVSVTE